MSYTCLIAPSQRSPWTSYPLPQMSGLQTPMCTLSPASPTLSPQAASRFGPPEDLVMGGTPQSLDGTHKGKTYGKTHGTMDDGTGVADLWKPPRAMKVSIGVMMVS